MLTLVGMLALVGVAWLNKVVTAEKSQQSKMFDAGALTFAQSVFSRSEDIRAMGLLPSIMKRWGASMAMSLKSGDEAASQASKFYGISKAVRKFVSSPAQPTCGLRTFLRGRPRPYRRYLQRYQKQRDHLPLKRSPRKGNVIQ